MGNYYRPHPNTQETLDRIMEEIEHEGDYTLRGKPDMRLDLRDRIEQILTAQEGEYALFTSEQRDRIFKAWEDSQEHEDGGYFAEWVNDNSLPTPPENK